MTFFIVLFIVLMQFLWKYIDDLVGKGLGMDVLAELFFYAAVSMVPMALPLAILLASLMTFGNFGEKFELTAMKASGISLLRVMAPLIVFISCVAVGAFFFQNNVLPHAQVKMWTLLFSMKQKSPELEIPESVFYDQIPGYNIFVRHKNPTTGMLHGVMIYDVGRGGDNATILLADSTRLSFTKDLRYLYLHLYKGEQFENLRDQSVSDQNVPFRREEFSEKEVLIPFDANFNRLDEGGMRKQYVGKNITELRHTVDSVGRRVDSIGRVYTRELQAGSMPLVAGVSGKDRAADGGADQTMSLDIDSLLQVLDDGKRAEVLASARSLCARKMAEVDFKAMTMSDEKKTIRRHEIELIKKFTLSVACLIFFFIGAPLGAIIRKGGIGTPLVISVLLFLVYYIIDNTGYKMARDGRWEVWFGMWLSTAILAPLGAFVTYKAMTDSNVFNPGSLKDFVTRSLGLRQDRFVAYREVVINDFSPSYAAVCLRDLTRRTRSLLYGCRRPQSLKAYWLCGYDIVLLGSIGDSIDHIVDYLGDSRDPAVTGLLPRYPMVFRLWILHPSKSRKWGMTMLFLFPLSVPVWLIGRLYQRRVIMDLIKILRINGRMLALLEGKV